MKELIEIRLVEHVNGYTVRGSLNLDSFIDEIQEERLDALKSIERWVKAEIISELERRTSHASEV